MNSTGFNGPSIALSHLNTATAKHSPRNIDVTSTASQLDENPFLPLPDYDIQDDLTPSNPHHNKENQSTFSASTSSPLRPQPQSSLPRYYSRLRLHRTFRIIIKRLKQIHLTTYFVPLLYISIFVVWTVFSQSTHALAMIPTLVPAFMLATTYWALYSPSYQYSYVLSQLTIANLITFGSTIVVFCIELFISGLLYVLLNFLMTDYQLDHNETYTYLNLPVLHSILFCVFCGVITGILEVVGFYNILRLNFNPKSKIYNSIASLHLNQQSSSSLLLNGNTRSDTSLHQNLAPTPNDYDSITEEINLNPATIQPLFAPTLTNNTATGATPHNSTTDQLSSLNDLRMQQQQGRNGSRYLDQLSKPPVPPIYDENYNNPYASDGVVDNFSDTNPTLTTTSSTLQTAPINSTDINDRPHDNIDSPYPIIAHSLKQLGRRVSSSLRSGRDIDGDDTSAARDHHVNPFVSPSPTFHHQEHQQSLNTARDSFDIGSMLTPIHGSPGTPLTTSTSVTPTSRTHRNNNPSFHFTYDKNALPDHHDRPIGQQLSPVSSPKQAQPRVEPPPRSQSPSQSQTIDNIDITTPSYNTNTPTSQYDFILRKGNNDSTPSWFYLKQSQNPLNNTNNQSLDSSTNNQSTKEYNEPIGHNKADHTLLNIPTSHLTRNINSNTNTTHHLDGKYQDHQVSSSLDAKYSPTQSNPKTYNRSIIPTVLPYHPTTSFLPTTLSNVSAHHEPDFMITSTHPHHDVQPSVLSLGTMRRPSIASGIQHMRKHHSSSPAPSSHTQNPVEHLPTTTTTTMTPPMDTIEPISMDQIIHPAYKIRLLSILFTFVTTLHIISLCAIEATSHHHFNRSAVEDSIWVLCVSLMIIFIPKVMLLYNLALKQSLFVHFRCNLYYSVAQRMIPSVILYSIYHTHVLLCLFRLYTSHYAATLLLFLIPSFGLGMTMTYNNMKLEENFPYFYLRTGSLSIQDTKRVNQEVFYYPNQPFIRSYYVYANTSQQPLPSHPAQLQYHSTREDSVNNENDPSISPTNTNNDDENHANDIHHSPQQFHPRYKGPQLLVDEQQVNYQLCQPALNKKKNQSSHHKRLDPYNNVPISTAQQLINKLKKNAQSAPHSSQIPLQQSDSSRKTHDLSHDLHDVNDSRQNLNSTVPFSSSATNPSHKNREDSTVSQLQHQLSRSNSVSRRSFSTTSDIDEKFDR